MKIRTEGREADRQTDRQTGENGGPIFRTLEVMKRGGNMKVVSQ